MPDEDKNFDEVTCTLYMSLEDPVRVLRLPIIFFGQSEKLSCFYSEQAIQELEQNQGHPTDRSGRLSVRRTFTPLELL